MNRRMVRMYTRVGQDDKLISHSYPKRKKARRLKFVEKTKTRSIVSALCIKKTSC